MSEEFGIDNIGIAVNDLDSSLGFYESLGFEEDQRDQTSAVVRRGSARLYLFKSNDSINLAKRPLKMNDTDAGIDHISFRISNLTDLIKRLLDVKIEIESGPIKQPWGPTTITVLDPSGVRLWFLHYSS